MTEQRKKSILTAAAERIKKAFPHTRIVIITSLVDPEVLARARRGAAWPACGTRTTARRNCWMW